MCCSLRYIRNSCTICLDDSFTITTSWTRTVRGRRQSKRTHSRSIHSFSRDYRQKPGTTPIISKKWTTSMALRYFITVLAGLHVHVPWVPHVCACGQSERTAWPKETCRYTAWSEIMRLCYPVRWEWPATCPVHTVIQRASMFDLHRTLSVTSHSGEQLYEAVTRQLEKDRSSRGCPDGLKGRAQDWGRRHATTATFSDISTPCPRWNWARSLTTTEYYSLSSCLRKIIRIYNV